MSIFEFNDEILEQIREDDRKFAREDGFLEGRQAGLQEGRQTGLKEGRQAGLQEGRQAGLKEGHIDAIQKMIRKDFSKETILDLGYSEEEYEKAKEGLLSSAVL